MNIKLTNRNFADFLSTFPEITLPITLTPESQIEFSRQNSSIEPDLIHEFIGTLDNEETDEIIPCLRIADTHEFIVVIYWQASLMNYEYYLASYSPNGDLIDKKVIAGIKSNSEKVLTRVANMDADWNIYIAQSETQAEDLRGEFADIKHYSLELLPSGHIILTSN